ncbi:conserved hypothetical protein [Coccidioides posadasii str. Silveira]|uniref:Uncharacterized protein n=1 Tax=Coccidioides posadasii (strain RMSCC 757 / Silveira) TaxID=443226 RepID=E9D8V2_COCPS|nr:conserved hypothetical protein [Coccidioides posadasii str. Silveira]
MWWKVQRSTCRTAEVHSRSMWFCLLHLVSDLQGLVHFLGKFEVKSEVESIGLWMRRLTRMPDYAVRGPNLVRKNVDGLRFKHFVHAHTQNRTSSGCIQLNPSQLRIRTFAFVAGTYNSARKIPNQRNLGERVSLQDRTERVKTFCED